MPLANVESQDAWKSSGTARMVRTDAAIACNHDPRLLVESFDVALDHGFADHTRFRVYGIAFANDLNVHLNRRNAALSRELGDGVTCVFRMGLEFGDGDGVRASGVGQSFFDALRVFVLLVGHDDFDVRMPSVVGITIGEKIHAAFPRGFDDADVFRSFAPNGDRADLDMRMLDGDVGALTDGDFFVQGL